jgi:hypothetical protein
MIVVIPGTLALILLAVYKLRQRRTRLCREEQYMSPGALRVLRDS